MKTCFINLTIFAAGAVLASHAAAQPAPQTSDAAAATAAVSALKAPASAPRSLMVTANAITNVAANAKAVTPITGMRAAMVAGSVLLLADGIVDSAAMAAIHSPANGFVYER